MSILNLLPGKYSHDYDKWFRIIFAIADYGTDSIYYRIAEQFTLRCPEKWGERKQKLDGIWTSMINGEKKENRITLRTVLHWLKGEISVNNWNQLKNRVYAMYWPDSLMLMRPLLIII